MFKREWICYNNMSEAFETDLTEIPVLRKSAELQSPVTSRIAFLAIVPRDTIQHTFRTLITSSTL